MMPPRFPLLAALVLGALGCDAVIGPDVTLPPDAVPMDALDEYAVWYAEVEDCTHLTGSFADVRWFRVPYVNWWDPVWEQYAIGSWRAPHDIYVSVSHLEDENLVKHEIVHDLLQGGYTYDPLFFDCSRIAHEPPPD